MSQVFRHTVTRRRPTLVDDGRGGDYADWSNPTDADLPGWAIDAGDTVEDTINADSSTVSYTLRGPWGVDVTADDRLVVMGDECEIVGRVLKQPGPSPRTSHVVVRVRDRNG